LEGEERAGTRRNVRGGRAEGVSGTKRGIGAGVRKGKRHDKGGKNWSERIEVTEINPTNSERRDSKKEGSLKVQRKNAKERGRRKGPCKNGKSPIAVLPPRTKLDGPLWESCWWVRTSGKISPEAKKRVKGSHGHGRRED